MNAKPFVQLSFLPGASGKTAFWQPVKHHLADLAVGQVIAYPAFDGVAEDPEVTDFQSLQDYVLRQIPPGSVVIAQSMGGIFAVQAALDHQKNISALVLVATSGGIDLSAFDVQDWRADYQRDYALPDWFVVTKSQTVTQALSQIRCPVLLIWGDDDPISPVAVGQYLQQKITHAKLHVIQSGQHDLADVHAAQVSQLIRAFLEQL